MSRKTMREKAKANHHKGSKVDVRFNKMSPDEVAEFTTRRAAGEEEAKIIADLRRRKRA